PQMREVSTADAFNGWLSRASVGSEVLYHTGNLAAERSTVHLHFGSDDEPLDIVSPKAQVDDLARAVWQAYRAGRVVLYQCRFKRRGMQYFAKKVKRGGTSAESQND